jgi:hypothetical protein
LSTFGLEYEVGVLKDERDSRGNADSCESVCEATYTTLRLPSNDILSLLNCLSIHYIERVVEMEVLLEWRIIRVAFQGWLT